MLADSQAPSWSWFQPTSRENPFISKASSLSPGKVVQETSEQFFYSNPICPVPSTANCGCSSGVSPIFCLSRASSYRPLSRRSQALHKRSSFIRKSSTTGPFSTYCHHGFTTVPQRCADYCHDGFTAAYQKCADTCPSGSEKLSGWKSHCFKHSPMPNGSNKLHWKPSLSPKHQFPFQPHNFEQPYRGYASVQKKVRQIVPEQATIIPASEEVQNQQIGTTKTSDAGQDSLDSLAQFLKTPAPAKYSVTTSEATEIDANNNRMPAEETKRKYFSVTTASGQPERPTAPEFAFQNIPPAGQAAIAGGRNVLANGLTNQPTSFPFQQFIVMPAILPEQRKKLRVRRRCQNVKPNSCSPAPLLCQSNKISAPLTYLCPGPRPQGKGSASQAGLPRVTLHTCQATSTTRRRRICSTPVKDRTPAPREPAPPCCFYVCQMPPRTPCGCDCKTGVSPYKSKSRIVVRTADENVQSFTPIKSASTSSVALIKRTSSPKPVAFQPNDGGRPLISYASKTNPSLEVSSNSTTTELQIEYVTVRTSDKDVITGTRAKYIQSVPDGKQLEQIYPRGKEQAVVTKPVTTEQATSYSRDRLEQQDSIHMGPPSKIPPFSAATTVYPIVDNKPTSPDTGSSPPPQKTSAQKSALKSATGSSPSPSKSSKSARFRSIVETSEDAPKSSKTSLQRRPTAFVPSKKTGFTVYDAAAPKSTGSFQRRPTAFVPSGKIAAFTDNNAEGAPPKSQGSFQRRPTAFVPSGKSLQNKQDTEVPSNAPEIRSQGRWNDTKGGDDKVEIVKAPTILQFSTNTSSDGIETTEFVQITARFGSENQATTGTPVNSQPKNLLNSTGKMTSQANSKANSQGAPENQQVFCRTKSGRLRPKLSYETVCHGVDEPVFGGPYEDPIPFGGRSRSATRTNTRSNTSSCAKDPNRENCKKVPSGPFGPNTGSNTDQNANLPQPPRPLGTGKIKEDSEISGSTGSDSGSYNGEINTTGPGSLPPKPGARQANLPPKPEIRPPLPPKPQQTPKAPPGKANRASRAPPAWHPQRISHAGRTSFWRGSRKKRSSRSSNKKDTSNDKDPRASVGQQDASNAKNKDNQFATGGQPQPSMGPNQMRPNSLIQNQMGNMFPLGCLPLGSMIIPQINAKEGNVRLPSALKCQKVCFADQVNGGSQSPRNSGVSGATLPITSPQGIPGFTTTPSPLCFYPHFQTNNMAGQATATSGALPGSLNGIIRGQTMNCPNPKVTIIPGMVYAPPGVMNQAADLLTGYKRRVTGGRKC